MCVIICGNPQDIKKEYLEKAFKTNPHGFGLMYVRNNKIISEKFVTKNFKTILKAFKKHSKFTNEIGLHFRYATVGSINNFNSHPFTILNKKLGDNFDISLMHNSPRIVAPILDDSKSDTYFFSNIILRPILKSKPDLIADEKFLKSLESIVNAEGNSRVLLLNSLNNKFDFVGDWINWNNLKVSNTYSLEEYKPISYSSHSSFYNHNSIEFETTKTVAKDTKEIPFKTYGQSKNRLKIDYDSLIDIMEVLDNGTKFDIFKKIRKLKHIEIADLLSQIADERYFNEYDNTREIQINDLK